MDYFNGSNTITVEEIDILSEIPQDLANTLAIGPQELFLTNLDRFNDMLNNKGCGTIGVNKKWNWKPGSYNKVKEYLSEQLSMNKKTTGMDKLIDRTCDSMNYLTYIRRRAKEMERERANLKYLGVSPDVDIDEFKATCSSFYDKLTKDSESVRQMTNGKVDIKYYLELDVSRHMRIYFDIILNDLTFSIFQGRDASAKLIQEIPLSPIHLVMGFNLRGLLGNQSRHSLNANLRGLYMNPLDSGVSTRLRVFQYPYLSSSSDASYGNICFDYHLDDVYKCIMDKDMINLSMVLLTWAQYYNTSFANPYQQPFMLHLGLPEGYSKEYSTAMGNLVDICSNRINRIPMVEKEFPTDYTKRKIDICDSSKCTVWDKCGFYKDNTIKSAKLNDEEWRYKAESLAGWCVEMMLSDIHCDNNLSDLRDDYHYKHSIISPRYIKAFDFADTNEELQEIFVDAIIDYWAECNGFEAIAWNLEEKGYIYWDTLVVKEESKSSVDMKEDELKRLMKQWAESSERGEI